MQLDSNTWGGSSDTSQFGLLFVVCILHFRGDCQSYSQARGATIYVPMQPECQLSFRVEFNTSRSHIKIGYPPTITIEASRELSPFICLAPLSCKTYRFCWSLPFPMEFFFSLYQVRLHNYEKTEITFTTNSFTKRGFISFPYQCFRPFLKPPCCPFLFRGLGCT